MPSRFELLRIDLQHRALVGIERLAFRLGRKPAIAPHLRTGLRGEFEALFFLRRQGYILIERRWRSPNHNGDIDLIGWDRQTLCFVEVKTRTARDLFPARLAIDDAKRSMLRSMGRAFLRTLPRQSRDHIPIRFDVLSVYLLDGRVECELLQAAFPLADDYRRRYGV